MTLLIKSRPAPIIRPEEFTLPRRLKCCASNPQALQNYLTKTQDTPQHYLASIARTGRELLRIECEPSLRFDLIEVLYRASSQWLLTTKPWPNGDKKKHSSDPKLLGMANYLLDILGQLYQFLLDQCLEQQRVRSLRQLSPIIAQRLLWCRYLKLERQALTHCLHPKDLWLSLHDLWRLGYSRRWLSKIIADPCFGAHPWATPYHRALLLGTSGCSQLTHSQLALLPALVAQLAPFLQLSLAAHQASAKTRHSWLLPLNQDHAPRRFLAHNMPPSIQIPCTQPPDIQTEQQQHHLILTTAVAKLKTLKSGLSGLAGHLLRQWDEPIPRTQRRYSHQCKLPVAIGLEAVRMIALQKQPTKLFWVQSQNTSPAGLKVKAPLPENTIEVGELIAFKESNRVYWCLAFVCWLQKNPSEQGMTFGIRCLAACKHAAWVRAYSADGAKISPVPAMIIKNMALSKQKLLILPKKIFQPGQRILLNLDQDLEKAEMGITLLSTPTFCIAEVKAIQH